MIAQPGGEGSVPYFSVAREVTKLIFTQIGETTQRVFTHHFAPFGLFVHAQACARVWVWTLNYVASAAFLFLGLTSAGAGGVMEHFEFWCFCKAVSFQSSFYVRGLNAVRMFLKSACLKLKIDLRCARTWLPQFTFDQGTRRNTNALKSISNRISPHRGVQLTIWVLLLAFEFTVLLLLLLLLLLMLLLLLLLLLVKSVVCSVAGE